MKFNNGKTISCVINFDDETKKEAFGSNTARLFDLGSVYSILHEKDIEVDGKPKTPHGHLVIEADKGQSSDNWILLLSTTYQVPRECISVECVKNKGNDGKPDAVGAIRYLLHLDNKEKHRYSKEEVITNNAEHFETVISTFKSLGALKASDLVQYGSAAELVDGLGVKNGAKLMNLWKTLRAEAKENEFRNQKMVRLECTIDLISEEVYRLLSQYGPSVPRRELENLLKAYENPFNIPLEVLKKSRFYNNEKNPFLEDYENAKSKD